MHHDIRVLGNGRYSHWKGSILFSTTDNSDPRYNGKNYQIKYPVISWRLRFLISTIFFINTICIIVFVLIKFWPQEKKSSDRALLVVSFSILLLVFVITRLPFFLYYPLPFFTPDSHSYLYPYEQFLHGDMPSFSTRLPGYPVFLGIVLSLTHSYLMVVFVQTVLLFASVFMLLYAIYKYRTYLQIPAMTALLLFIISPHCTASDFCILSESLYTSTLILFMAFLLLSLVTKKSIYFFLCSFCMGWAILVRPAAIYFLVSYLLILAFLAVNRYGVKKILFFMVPLPFLLFCVIAYNSIAMNTKSISVNFGKSLIFMITSTYWTPSDNLPDSVNEVLSEYRENMPEDDKKILYSSWDFKKLYPIYIDYQVKAYISEIPKNGEFIHSNRDLQQKIGKTAVKNNFMKYIKFVSTMYYFYYFEYFYIMVSPYYDSISYHYDKYYFQENDPPAILKEYTSPPQTRYINVVDSPKGRKVEIVPTFLQSIHKRFYFYQSLIFTRFKNFVIISLFLLIGLGTFIMTIIRKYKDEGVFYMFIIITTHLGMASTNCLVNPSLFRFVSPGDFLVFLAFACLPMMFQNKSSQSGD